MNPLNYFLKNGGSELVKKALTSASNSGGALVPESLRQAITDTAIKLSPEFALISSEQATGKTHEFNQLTSRGNIGGSMGENAVTPQTNSTYTRATVDLKVTRRKGLVTDFEQEAAAKFTDALQLEINSQIEQQVYNLNLLNLYGNELANTYQYGGWNRRISTNRYQTGFSSGAPTVPGSLRVLDAMIDASNRNGGGRHRRAFIMSPEMHSLFSSLLTNVRNVQGAVNGATQINIGGGWVLDAYRNIPIVESSFVPGSLSSTMGTVTAATGGTTGGTFADGTYYFRVDAITANGPTMASAESSVTLSGGGSTQKITLSFTAVTDAIGYRVYYSATTGLTGMTMIDWVAANAYDSDGTIGAAVTSISILSATPTANVPTAVQADKPLTAVSSVKGEEIYLIDFDSVQGMGSFALLNKGSAGNGLISMKPVYPSDAGLPFLLYTHGSIVPAFEGTSVVSRGWRAA
jgi:hypothetical protein